MKNILKAISKSIGNEITEDMDLLKVIGKVTNNKDVKSIVNSVNSNQLMSKEWLIDTIRPKLELMDNPRICVAAGWYGNLADMLREYTDEKVVSFDMDPKCAEIGKILYPEVKFETQSIEEFDPTKFDVIICTSCEHITDKTINDFISKRKKVGLNRSNKTFVVLQSNDYYGLKEHVNCKRNLSEFKWSIKMNVINSLEKRIDDKFNRFMLVGY
tara:strand:- start:81 stop:722 length:642 start_codon:yes stop_codon:yes gene_type:complete